LLHQLGLDEYFETLTRQGYTTIDSLLDITWEDLEEIGIRKLGKNQV
jgi:SAM domain (Sterile alpha motif)